MSRAVLLKVSCSREPNTEILRCAQDDDSQNENWILVEPLSSLVVGAFDAELAEEEGLVEG